MIASGLATELPPGTRSERIGRRAGRLHRDTNAVVAVLDVQQHALRVGSGHARVVDHAEPGPGAAVGAHRIVIAALPLARRDAGLRSRPGPSLPGMLVVERLAVDLQHEARRRVVDLAEGDEELHRRRLRSWLEEHVAHL